MKPGKTTVYFYSVLLLSLALFRGASAYATPYIIGVSIPEGSQGAGSRPAMDNVWSVSGAFDPNIGIGIIVKPTWISENVQSDFALHENDHNYSGPPDYIHPNVPNPVANTITYTFNEGVIVSGVRVVQHVVGITEVTGALGNAPDSLVNLGSVFGPAGDITSGSLVAHDGDIQDFFFGNTAIYGSVFTLTVSKTVFFDAYAVHRIFPLDQYGNPILPMSSSVVGPHEVPESGSGFLYLCIAVVAGALQRFRLDRSAAGQDRAPWRRGAVP